MGRVRRASTLGLATGAIGVLIALVHTVASLEDSVGLRALFHLRGPLPSPPGVVIVSIDESAVAVRKLPRGELEVHPRTPHAFEKARVERVARSVAEFLGLRHQPAA